MPVSETALPLRIGARTLWTVRRRLVRRRLTLEEALGGRPPVLPPLGDGHGYLLTGLPAGLAEAFRRERPDFAAFVRQSYSRSYARLDLGFAAYLAGFSGKSRSTLKRKTRRLAERSGGSLDLRLYRTAEEMEPFYRDARRLSARTYQERRLGAGLPEGEAALAAMQALAARDQVRAWLLYLDDRPISYLYAPAEGETLIYAYLGYDPDHAELSPGTVLQLEAMRQLMEERRFRLFDFTEGEGQHKRLFATGHLACVDLLLVRRTPANLATGWLLAGFDSGVAAAKKLVQAAGADGVLRRIRR